MAWQRWTFHDEVAMEDWTFTINPREVTEPGVDKQVSSLGTTAPDGLPILFEAQAPAQDISWKGLLLDVATRETFKYWARKRNQILLTNDMGEELWIYIDKFKPNRKRVASRPYKAEYDLHAWIVDIPA